MEGIEEEGVGNVIEDERMKMEKKKKWERREIEI